VASPPDPPSPRRNSRWFSNFPRNAAKVKGLIRYWVIPVEIADRITCRCRTAVIAMMSTSLPRAFNRPATSIPCESVRFISSRTISTGVPPASSSSKRSMASCPLRQVAATSKPGTLATKSACACAVSGSSSTMSTGSRSSSLISVSFLDGQRDREDRPAVGIDLDIPAEAAHRLPDEDESESAPAWLLGRGLGRSAEVEERLDLIGVHALTGIGDGDDEFSLGGDEVRPHVLVRRVGGRVEGVVEQVAGHGDQVAGVEGPGRQLAGGGDREFDAAFMGLGGLADHQGGDEGLVERADEGVRQPLRLLLVADGEVERLLSAPEFDE